MLAACLEDHRQLYNAALQERRDAYRKRAVTLRYDDQSAQLREIRGADPGGQGRWSAGSQQQTLRRLDRAFAAFFRRVKAGARAGFPRFKGRGWFDTVEWPAVKNGARWNSTPHDPTTRVYLIGIGHMRVHQHRQVTGTVKTISVKREGRRWYVVLSCDDVPIRPLPAAGGAVGIDMGIISFLSTSDGDHVPNPHHAREASVKLEKAQQALARCKRGSRRRAKARARVAGLHGKIRRQRVDHAHKVALTLVRGHDVVVHEDLRVANMVRRPTPRLADDKTFLPNGAAAKAGLNRSIADAGWRMFLTILAHKAESAGRTLIAISPANTSRTCTRCGHCAAENRISQAAFRCRACGYTAHADVNAALNILRAGLALQDAQAD